MPICTTDTDPNSFNPQSAIVNYVDRPRRPFVTCPSPAVSSRRIPFFNLVKSVFLCPSINGPPSNVPVNV